jgi:hypothetical protein
MESHAGPFGCLTAPGARLGLRAQMGRLQGPPGETRDWRPLLSRNRRALEPYFPEVASAALESIPEECSLDGELVGLRDGKPEFSALLERLRRRVGCPVQFVAFDLLEVGGEDLSALPLTERRSRLEDIIPEGSPISATVQTDAVGLAQEWLRRSRELHLEAWSRNERVSPTAAASVPGSRSSTLRRSTSWWVAALVLVTASACFWAPMTGTVR